MLISPICTTMPDRTAHARFTCFIIVAVPLLRPGCQTRWRVKPTLPAAAGTSTRHWGHGRFPARISCPGHRPGCIRHRARGGSAARPCRPRPQGCARRLSARGRKAGRKARPTSLDEGEVGLPVAAVVIIEEDTADAARALAMRDVEILVRPFLETRIEIRVMPRAMLFLQGVEMGGVLGIFDAGVQVRPRRRTTSRAASRTYGYSW